MAGAHKKFHRVQHAEIYLLDLKVQYKHKMKLPLAMVSKHIFLYLCLPDYKSSAGGALTTEEKTVLGIKSTITDRKSFSKAFTLTQRLP